MSSRSLQILKNALKNESGAPEIKQETKKKQFSKINILSHVVIPPNRSEITKSLSGAEGCSKLSPNISQDVAQVRSDIRQEHKQKLDAKKKDFTHIQNDQPTFSGYIDDKDDPFEDSSSSYEPESSSSSEEEGENQTQKKRKRVEVKRKQKEEKKENKDDKKQIRKRSKKANKEMWKQTINKKLRLSGKKYINRSGKEVPEKRPKGVDCNKCRFKCQEKITETQREKLCMEYYSLADDAKQKIYLSSLMQNVSVAKKKNSPKTKNRQTSRVFFLKNANRESQRVCRNFFCKTFAISHRIVENCAKNTSCDTGLYTGFDKRKNSRPPHATSEEAKLLVQQHIDLFPKVESHYCRKDSKKLYLSPELNISVMYRLYKNDFCNEKKIQPVSLFVYQKIFHEFEPALAFHVPKKDQCSQCNAYHQATNKEPLTEEYNKHKKREQESMTMKSEDKKRAASEHGKTFRSITFDLQAILPLPYAGDSQIFYRHKLNVYNFTIYDASTSDGYCFIWDETHGNKGSAEIGTCLLKYLQGLPNTVCHVASFSDTCSGQNRNKNVAAAMLYAVSHINHMKTIDLKFMESGHSYLEADSMHATIERAKRHKKIYSTREWCLLVSASRIRPKQYIVENLKFDDFFDLQNLVKNYVLNTTINTKKEKVNWLNIKWLRFEKEKPSIIQYKYSLSQENFEEIEVNCKGRAGRKKTITNLELNQKYMTRLPVSHKKKKDLEYLLKSKVIPDEYTQFIHDIPESNNIPSRNEESDFSD